MRAKVNQHFKTFLNCADFSLSRPVLPFGNCPKHRPLFMDTVALILGVCGMLVAFVALTRNPVAAKATGVGNVIKAGYTLGIIGASSGAIQLGYELGTGCD